MEKKDMIFTPLLNYNKRPYHKWKEENHFKCDEIKKGNTFKFFKDKKEESGIITGKSVLTGEISNITVLDIDITDDGKKNGYEQFSELLEESGYTGKLDTFTVETPHGGMHLYFKYTNKLKNKSNINKEKYPHIDIKNNGGLIVAPGSEVTSDKNLFEGTREYKVIADVPIIEMPEELLETLTKYAGYKRETPKQKNETVKQKNEIFSECRNESLFKYVYEFCVKYNVRSLNEITELAHAFNKLKCNPPLGTVKGEENEVNNIANSIYKYLEDHYINKKGTLNHTLFVQKLISENHIFTNNDRLAIYDNEKGYYKTFSSSELEKKWISNQIEHKPCITYDLLSKLLKLLKSETITDDNLRYEKKYINCRNGIFDIEKESLLNHTPKLLSTHQINASLISLETFNDVFEKSRLKTFLNSIMEKDQERIDVLQEMVGLALSPHAREVKKAFVLYGNGNNGKSIIITLLQNLLGDENIGSVPIADFKEKFSASTLVNKLVNLVDDDPSENVKEPKNWKSLVAGQVVSVESKFKDATLTTPNLTHIRGMNNLPTTSDKTDGFFSRNVIIPFNNSYGSLEEVKQGRRKNVADPLLTNRLLDEIDIFFTWGVLGLLRLQKNEWVLTSSTAIEQENENYRLEVDSLYKYIIEKIEVTNNPDDKLGTKDIYLHYTNWCADQQYTPVGRNKIKSKLEELTGIRQDPYPNKKTGDRFFRGLKFK